MSTRSASLRQPPARAALVRRRFVRRGALRRLPRWALVAMVAASNLLVTGAIVLSDDPAGPLVLLYLWATPCSFAFFTRRQALAQAAVVAAAYLVAIAALGGSLSGADVLRWVIFVLTLSAVSVLADRLTHALSASSRRLRQRAAQQAAVSELGRSALFGMDVSRLIDETVTVLARTLDVELACVLELWPEQECFAMRAETGWGSEVKRTLRIPLDSSTQATHAVRTRKPVILEDLHAETRFHGSKALFDNGVRSGMNVIIDGPDEPFGILAAHTRRLREFSEDDINVLQALANVLAAAVARERAEEETRHRALHDPLTGLPNRTLFLDRLSRALARCERHAEFAAVFFLDVDQFKLINDSLGHASGDRVLCELAPRLAEALRRGDTIARLGGDEFVVLCEEVGSEAEALEVADRVMSAFDEPFVVGGSEHHVTASIGVAIANGREQPEAVLRDADSAMYRAKERGRARYELFDEEMRSRALDRLNTEVALRRAIERDELRVFYQPVVRVDSGEIVAAEALLRWDRPDYGVVPPAGFIPIAEESGLIVKLGEWVLRRACQDAARWNEAGLGRGRDLSVTVNLSARQLAEPGLVDMVRDVLEETQLDPPGALGLEITESVLMEDMDAAIETLNALRELGVTIVLDDFGAGYSSLLYVKRLPLHLLKLDRSFADDLAGESKDAAIVAAVVALSRAIGVRVVAEGIETEEQARQVTALGCQYAQGYWFARPMPGEQIAEIFSEPLPLETTAVHG